MAASKSDACAGSDSFISAVNASAASASSVGSSQKCGSVSPPSPDPSGVAQRDGLRSVDHVVGAVVAHGVVDGRLQPLLVEDDRRTGDSGRLARGELDVVWLDPRCGQVGDLRVVPDDPLGDVLQRVEGGHDPAVAPVGARRP